MNLHHTTQGIGVAKNIHPCTWVCGVGAGEDGDTLLVPGPGRRHHVARVVVVEAALDELRRVRLVDVAVC